MSLVRQDCHGLYIKCGGYVFRPIFPVGYNHVFKNGTKFVQGDTVRGYHKGGTQLGTVQKDGTKETWFTHGFYYDDKGGKVPSEDLFKPSYEIWL